MASPVARAKHTSATNATPCSAAQSRKTGSKAMNREQTSSLRSNMLVAIVLSDPIGRPGIISRALWPDPALTLVASNRTAESTT